MVNQFEHPAAGLVGANGPGRGRKTDRNDSGVKTCDGTVLFTTQKTSGAGRDDWVHVLSRFARDWKAASIRWRAPEACHRQRAAFEHGNADFYGSTLPCEDNNNDDDRGRCCGHTFGWRRGTRVDQNHPSAAVHRAGAGMQSRFKNRAPQSADRTVVDCTRAVGLRAGHRGGNCARDNEPLDPEE